MPPGPSSLRLSGLFGIIQKGQSTPREDFPRFTQILRSS